MRLQRSVLLLCLWSAVVCAQGPTSTDWHSSVTQGGIAADPKATSVTSNNLNAVHGRGRPDVPGLASGEVWAVGDNGTIIFYDGSSGNWVTQASGVTAHLRAVYIYPWDILVAGTSIAGWACGDGGTLLKLTKAGGLYSWNIANNPAGACGLPTDGGALHVCADMLAIFPANSSTGMTHLFITGEAMCGCGGGPAGPDTVPCPSFGPNPLLVDLDTSTTIWQVIKLGTAPYNTNTAPNFFHTCADEIAYTGLITNASGGPATPATEGFTLESGTYRSHYNLVNTVWSRGNLLLQSNCGGFTPPFPAYYGAARIGPNVIVVGDTDPGTPDCVTSPAQTIPPYLKVPANVFVYDQFTGGEAMHSLGTGLVPSATNWGTLRSLAWLNVWGFGVAVGSGSPSGTGFSGSMPDAYFGLINAPDSLKFFYQDDPTSRNAIIYQQMPLGTTWPRLNGVFLSRYNEGWAVGNVDTGTTKGAILHWTGPTVTPPLFVVSLTSSPAGALLPNSLVEFVLTVTNTGGTGAVNFNAVLPAPAQVFSADQPPGVPFCGSTTFSCPTTLPPGASASFTWTFSTTACVTGVTFTGMASGIDVNLGSSVSSATTWVFGSSGVSLTSTLFLNRGLPPPSPGTPAQYEIVVTNTGAAGMTSLRVVDTLPALLSSLSFYQPAGFPAPTVVTNAGGGTIVAWSSTLTSVPPGGKLTFTVTGLVLAACQSQELSATGWARGADVCGNAAQQGAGVASFLVTGPMTASMALNKVTEQVPGRYLLEITMTVSDTGVGCLKPLTPAPTLMVIPAGLETILQSSPMSGTCDAVAPLPAVICTPDPCSRSFTWTYLNTAANPVTFIGTATATVFSGPCAVSPCMVGGNQCIATAQLTVTFFSTSGDPGTITLNRNLFRPHGLNQKLTVSFNVKENGEVSVIVYNSIGQRIKTLFKKYAARRQQYDVTWDGTNDGGERVSSGAYFIRLESTRYVITKKVALIK